jgi:hypothetical protein
MHVMLPISHPLYLYLPYVNASSQDHVHPNMSHLRSMNAIDCVNFMLDVVYGGIELD